VLLVGLLTVAPVVRWRSTHLVVTTHRLVVREGSRRPRSLEVRLDRIADVRTRHGRLGRMIGCGALVVVGADGEAEFVDVPDAEQVRAVLQQARAAG
jgi:membrane protein YdbS with pleckstrin-like domain